METYHKIDSVFKRDPDNRHKTFLIGEYSRPEFELLADIDWTWTEKIDGTNIRIDVNETQTRFGGRSDNAQIPAFLVDHLRDKFPDNTIDKLDGAIVRYSERPINDEMKL